MPTPGHYEYIELDPKLFNEDFTEDTSVNDDLPASFVSNVKRGTATPVKNRSLTEGTSFDMFNVQLPNQPTMQPSNDLGALLSVIINKLDRIIALLEEN